jgi:hypothetical protein
LAGGTFEDGVLAGAEPVVEGADVPGLLAVLVGPGFQL